MEIPVQELIKVLPLLKNPEVRGTQAKAATYIFSQHGEGTRVTFTGVTDDSLSGSTNVGDFTISYDFGYCLGKASEIVAVPGTAMAKMKAFAGKDKVLTLTAEREECTLVSDGSELIRRIHRPVAVPAVHKADLADVKAITWEAPEGFMANIAPTVSVAADDMSRPILCGVNFRGQAGKFSVTCTDSYHLFISDFAKLDSPVPDGECLVPKYVAVLAGKIDAARNGAKVESVTASEDTWAGKRTDPMTIKAGPFTLTFLPTDGKFPNYLGLVPNVENVDLSVSVGALRPGVTKILAMNMGESSPIRLSQTDGVTSLSLTVQDEGTISVPIPDGEFSNPDGLTVCFNPTYLSNVIKGVGDDVRLAGVDSLKPWVAVWHVDDITFTRLLMPVRTT